MLKSIAPAFARIPRYRMAQAATAPPPNLLEKLRLKLDIRTRKNFSFPHRSVVGMSPADYRNAGLKDRRAVTLGRADTLRYASIRLELTATIGAFSHSTSHEYNLLILVVGDHMDSSKERRAVGYGSLSFIYADMSKTWASLLLLWQVLLRHCSLLPPTS